MAVNVSEVQRKVGNSTCQLQQEMCGEFWSHEDTQVKNGDQELKGPLA